jgi:hypothetical protein
MFMRGARLPRGSRQDGGISETTRRKAVRAAITIAFVLAAAAWGDLVVSTVVRPNLPQGHLETARDRTANEMVFAFPLIGLAGLVIALTAFFVARRQTTARRWAGAAALAATTAPIAFIVIIMIVLSHLDG